MQAYLLTAPIVGIEQSATGRQIVQIASGEILIIPDIQKESGLVEIVCRGRSAAAFVQDLRARTKRVEITTLVKACLQSDGSDGEHSEGCSGEHQQWQNRRPNGSEAKLAIDGAVEAHSCALAHGKAFVKQEV